MNSSNARPKKKAGAKAETAFDFVGLVSMFVIALGSIGIYHMALGGSAEQPAMGQPDAGAARGIVVVDAKAALKAFMVTVEQRIAAGADFTEASLQMQGADFGAEFLRAVKRYEDAGYIVLDRGQVLGTPPKADITREIADALGLDIDLAQEDVLVPTLTGR